MVRWPAPGATGSVCGACRKSKARKYRAEVVEPTVYRLYLEFPCQEDIKEIAVQDGWDGLARQIELLMTRT
jgi:hypothetical protein